MCVDVITGMTKTYQRGDIGQYGITQKVFYKSTYQVTNELTCLQIGGSGYPPLLPQTVLPDVSGMKVALSLALCCVRCPDAGGMCRWSAHVSSTIGVSEEKNLLIFFIENEN